MEAGDRLDSADGRILRGIAGIGFGAGVRFIKVAHQIAIRIDQEWARGKYGRNVIGFSDAGCLLFVIETVAIGIGGVGVGAGVGSRDKFARAGFGLVVQAIIVRIRIVWIGAGIGRGEEELRAGLHLVLEAIAVGVGFRVQWITAICDFHIVVDPIAVGVGFVWIGVVDE